MPRRCDPPPVPTTLASLAAGRRGVVTTAELRDHGLCAADVARLRRARVLHQVLRSAWALGAVPGVRQRIIAAALVVHPDAVVSLESGAALLDWRQARAEELIHLWLPPGATRGQERPGVRLHWSLVQAHERTVVDGVQVTAPARLARDFLRFRPRTQAVAGLDQGLRCGGLDPQVLADVFATVRGPRRLWAELADARSESPLETAVRLILRDAGLEPEPQIEVRDVSGRIVGRIDLGWRTVMIGVECDGEGPHGEPAALLRDRRRQDDLEALGWTLVRVTWTNVIRDPEGIVRRVRRKLALRGA